ncbi:hypothetical protein AUJ66_04735 [Candidatus Desantisbacteria bacterium CG1_02_38_46]|uniref:Nucleotidyl transferase AbiEii/AbiGii toxin family protein n=3 Tax=unclassified Candidatus Desantisiibacteriota TaxID=3106372 RepID=A0A2H9PBC0_9BACT|nr:MAG: hypothetical protein AUJ66_04735 [Candidatus Desantisbacteria bacterium CG1_02_38_46]PIZ16057.1 MAG: hypothetical protein COY51_03695 [Candidatus Desantisbacteria bacterium CG_4_10_14_0_8_um_filter_39_17]
MITLEFLENVSVKNQTNVVNVIREYCQHLFLSYFYQEDDSEQVLFKGGTALKIIHQSPRFSEDLDFSGFSISFKKIEDLLETILSKMEGEGIETDIVESKKTTGGYLGVIHFQIFSYSPQIQLEISLRKQTSVKGATALIHSEILPPYTLIYLPDHMLIKEKINALLERQKPRDFFDLYFILRSRIPGVEKIRREGGLRHKILKILEEKKIDFKTELSIFLPRSYHRLLPEFKTILKKEVEKWM